MGVELGEFGKGIEEGAGFVRDAPVGFQDEGDEN